MAAGRKGTASGGAAAGGSGEGALERLERELAAAADPAKAAFLPGFFRAVPGGYGEGDRFLGVAVPAQRQAARRFARELTLEETARLLDSPWHEHRLTALFILVRRFEAAKEEAAREEIVRLYLAHLGSVNNWDLVDSSAPHLLGAWLFGRDRGLLDELAASGDLWRQRVAVLATQHFIRRGEFADTLRLAGRLLAHPHDLIHKAVGWMLREVIERGPEAGLAFLRRHHAAMPRTMLRYAIEKLEPGLRQAFLRGAV